MKKLVYLFLAISIAVLGCKSDKKQQKEEQPQVYVYENQDYNFSVQFTQKPKVTGSKITVNNKPYDLIYFNYEDPQSQYVEVVAIVQGDQMLANQANPQRVIDTFAQAFKQNFKISKFTKEEINNLPQYPSYIIVGKTDDGLYITLQLILKGDRIYAISFLSKKQDTAKANQFLESFKFLE